MKIYTIIFVAVVLSFAGCSSSVVEKKEDANAPKSEAVQTDSEKNTSDASEDAAKVSETNEKVESPTASMSPSDVIKAFSKATQAKDAEKIKSFLSKGSINEIEKSAKEQGTTVEKLLTDGAEEDPVDPEVRNEKIDGDTATVEVKNETLGNYDVMPFVKENGVWKIALDKFMAEMMKKINAIPQAPPPEAK